MLLSNGRLTRLLMAGALVAVVAFACVPAASADATSSEKPEFCKPRVIHEGLAQFRRMPKLHTPPPSGRLGFGPRSVALSPAPAILDGAGAIGYRLFLRPGFKPARPNWDVTTTLARVNARGQVIEAINRTRRAVDTVARGHAAGAHFQVVGQPAFYRVTALFRNPRGRRLGRYGFYFRVGERIERARLVLSSESYRPGETLLGRVDNVGTAVVVYKRAYRLRNLDGVDWEQAAEKPRLVTGHRTIVPGGSSGYQCLRLSIPESMPPGRYRMRIRGMFSQPRGKGPHLTIAHPARLTAEFDVVPG